MADKWREEIVLYELRNGLEGQNRPLELLRQDYAATAERLGKLATEVNYHGRTEGDSARKLFVLPQVEIVSLPLNGRRFLNEHRHRIAAARRGGPGHAVVGIELNAVGRSPYVRLDLAGQPDVYGPLLRTADEIFASNQFTARATPLPTS